MKLDIETMKLQENHTHKLPFIFEIGEQLIKLSYKVSKFKFWHVCKSYSVMKTGQIVIGA